MKKRSLIYDILKFFFSIAHRLFYKEIVVTGRENIPKEGALIFAPNHQNGLMDPLGVLFTNRRMTVFLGRGDIFYNPLIAKLLTLLKILPIYRIRDGKDSLEKNNEIFRKTVEILEYKGALCLFPETTHNDKRTLQQLKKGIQRIGFLAEEQNNFNMGIQIIPVGIYYSNYPASRSIIQVNYGKPLLIKDYFEIYLKNEQKAMLDIRDELTRRIKPLMIDIQNVDFYQLYESLRKISYRKVLHHMKLKVDQKNKFIADKVIIDRLDQFSSEHNSEMLVLKEKVLSYEEKLNKYKLIDDFFSEYFHPGKNPIFLMILLVLLSPLFAYVFVINFLPLKFIKKLVKGVEDTQFHSSFKFGLGSFIFPVYYSIISALLFLLPFSTLLISCLLICLWFSLYIFFRFREAFNFLLLKLRYSGLKKKNRKEFEKIVILRNEIDLAMSQILNYIVVP